MAAKKTKSISRMTKPQLIKELVGLGGESEKLEELGVRDLRATLKDVREAEEAGGQETSASEEEDETPAEDVGPSVDVLKGAEYIRTYSKEVHGADFKDLAEQFAGKVNGRTVVPSNKVEAIKVTYREEVKDKETGVRSTHVRSRIFKSREEAIAFANKVSNTPTQQGAGSMTAVMSKKAK